MFNCSMCLAGLIEDCVSTMCGHVYHKECLEKWISRSSDCPDCRSLLTEKLIHPVFLNDSNSTCDSNEKNEAEDSIDGLGIDELFLDDDEQDALKKEQNNASLKTVVKLNQELVVSLKKKVETLNTDLNLKHFEILDLQNKCKDTQDNLNAANENNISLVQHQHNLETELASYKLIVENFLITNPQ